MINLDAAPSPAHFDFLACFINAASAEYFARTGRPLVDEDMSMAFDAAHGYADVHHDAPIPYDPRGIAHAKGAAYIASFHTTPSGH